MEEVPEKEKSSYLSYNLLKYNRKDQAFKYVLYSMMILQNKKDIV